MNTEEEAKNEASLIRNYASRQNHKLVSDYLEDFESKVEAYISPVHICHAFLDAVTTADDDLFKITGWQTLNYYVSASEHDKALINQTLEDFCGYTLPRLVEEAIERTYLI